MGGDDQAGGSGTLAELIDEHGAALYSDFQSYYHLDLVQVVRERHPRFVLALVEGLPDNRCYAAAIQGGNEFRGWGADRHMQANLWDITALAGSVTESKNSKKAPKFPRPTDKKKAPAGATPFRALIGRDL